MVTYVKYVTGTEKGDFAPGELINSPFALGDCSGEEGGIKDYTAQAVVEGVEDVEEHKVAWLPLAVDENGKQIIRFLDAAGEELEATPDANGLFVNDETGAIVATFEDSEAENVFKIAYKYNNIVIPQKKLPTLVAKMESIPLIAKARRIAVFYSQIAAFQAKTDYGMDLGDQLAAQAVGRLQYEIDTEVTDLLFKTADGNAKVAPWSKTLPVGVSKMEHYAGFMENVEMAKTIIYNATKRFVANYMICARDVINVLSFIPQFKEASVSDINGPYFAGTLGAMKVFVTPNAEPGTYAVGVNGSDMMSSVAVYAPYMAIVPTQLLQAADGATSQGFSTLYDLKVLNEKLIVKGSIVA